MTASPRKQPPVLEACMFIAAAIFSVMLVAIAVYGPEKGTRKGVRVQMLEALAETLGPTVAVVVATVLVIGTGVWLALAVRAYRAR